MNIYTHLKAEHDEVKELLKKTESAPSKQRVSLLKEIKSKLVPHARAEEKTLYSVLHDAKTSKDLHKLNNEAYAEHETADYLLHELENMETEDEMWAAKFAVFKENVEHHIKEEETELFKKTKNYISEEASIEMLKAFKLEKKHFENSLPTQHQIKAKTPSSHLSE